MVLCLNDALVAQQSSFYQKFNALVLIRSISGLVFTEALVV